MLIFSKLKSPVVFSGIVTLLGVSPLLPVQPVNVYPSLLGLFNVNVSVSIVYVVGFGVNNVPSFKSYVI